MQGVKVKNGCLGLFAVFIMWLKFLLFPSWGCVATCVFVTMLNLSFSPILKKLKNQIPKLKKYPKLFKN